MRKQDLKSSTGVFRPTVSEGRAATPSFKLLFLMIPVSLDSVLSQMSLLCDTLSLTCIREPNNIEVEACGVHKKGIEEIP